MRFSIRRCIYSQALHPRPPSRHKVPRHRKLDPIRKRPGNRGGIVQMKKPVLKPAEHKCPECKGTGFKPVKQPMRPGVRTYPERCKECLEREGWPTEAALPRGLLTMARSSLRRFVGILVLREDSPVGTLWSLNFCSRCA